MSSNWSNFPFLAGGGDAARLICEFDWSATALGSITDWPQSLKTACGIVLQATVPLALLWGRDGYMLYNDAYAQLSGRRHPGLLGAKVAEAWPEAADFMADVMQKCLAGGKLAFRDQEFMLDRHGQSLQAYFDLDYSPVLNEAGAPAGVIAVVIETTQRVQAHRDLRSESERLRRLVEQAPGFVATMAGPDHVFEMANNAFFQLIGHRDLIGHSVRDVLPEMESQGFIDLLDRVYQTQERYIGHSVRVLVQPQPDIAAEERHLDFIFQPILDDDDRSLGIFVQGHDVSHRMQAEHTLRDSESRFRLIAESAPVMLWMADESGNCVYLNAAHRRFSGAVDQDGGHLNIISDAHPDDQALAQANFPKAVRELSSFAMEVRYQRAEGCYRLLQVSGQPRFDASGDFLGMIGVNVDVTDARNQEQRRIALIELNDRIRSLEDPADIAYAASEILGRLFGVSRVGYGTIDPVAETITIERDWNAPGIVSLAGVLQFRDYGSYIEDLKRGETVVFNDAEKDERSAENAAALIAISAQSIVNMPVSEQGGMVALLYLNNATAREWAPDDIGFIREVAERTRTAVERRRAEQALETFAGSLERQVVQRTAELDRIWRNSQDVLLVTDSGGHVQAVNPAWTLLLGHATSLVRDQMLIDFAMPEERKNLIAIMSEARTGPYTKSIEARFLHLDGTWRWIAWRFSYEDALLLAYGRDVTVEKERSLALKQAEEQLRHAQKMEAIGQLTGGIAHDFNNLLQVISGNLHMLGQDLEGNEKSSRRVQNALAGVHRGAKLANQLLAFGRRQPLEPKVVNVVRLINGIGEMLRRTLGETVEVETITGGGLWNTFVDPTQIENAVLNLAINARDAMDGQGKLTIEVGNAYIDEVYSRNHNDVEPGQYVMLAVTDTGVGMTPEVLQRVFEPFFSTKPAGKGTGLGLSMVYGFVKQSGGHVKIYSEVGQGTTIRIYLPRSMQTEDLLIDPQHGPLTGGPETILVAEDDEEVRATVVDILGHLGYRVLKARDAASALSVIESGVPVDLLFTDVVMPGALKSAEMARKAKERLPDLAVLFTSGYTENSIVHGGRLDPGVELLSKPYSREALARRIRHLLNNRAQVIEAKLRRAADDNAVKLAPSVLQPKEVAAPAPVTVRILVVEDEAFIRFDLVDALEAAGHNVVDVGSGEEAMKRLEEERFDVLLTDLGLPRMSGDDLAKAARAMDAGIGVIFATGNNNAPDLDVGPKPILLRKPYDPREVAAAIAAVARQL